MWKFTLFLVVVLGSSNASIAQINAKKTILETEQQRFEAMVGKDTVQLRTMLDSDLHYLHSNGLQENKQQHLTAIATGTINYLAMLRKPNPIVRRYGKMALVNGLVNVDGEIHGQAFSVLLRYTAVYRKKKRHWVLLNWQSTRVDSE